MSTHVTHAIRPAIHTGHKCRNSWFGAVLRCAGIAVLGSITWLSPSSAFAADVSPHEIERLVVEEARQSAIVPTEIAVAVARVESNFNASAESHKGARGVMQIMPRTARTEFGVDPDSLWDPRTNIRLGVMFLEDLYRAYGNRWDAALSHYNGGTLKGGMNRTSEPHEHTREYVASVMRWARHYHRDNVSQRMIASADSAESRRRASLSMPYQDTYWWSEPNDVDRDWRSHLRTADRWLDASRGEQIDWLDEDTLQTGEWDAVHRHASEYGIHTPRFANNSDRLHRASEYLRAKFRESLSWLNRRDDNHAAYRFYN